MSRVGWAGRGPPRSEERRPCLWGAQLPKDKLPSRECSASEHFVMTGELCICPARRGGHEPHVALERLKCGF